MKNNDAQLIQRTLAGDESAFSMLVRKYEKPVHALVWRKIGDFHIAEEITQDIFLRVYKKLQTLKNPNRFAGWLYVIAARRCFAWCKKKRIPMKSLDAMSTEELEELAYVQCGFQFTTALTENVLQEIARIKPTPTTNSKPWMPWAVAASTAALVVLLIGNGTQYLPRFQQPYSFDATSEMTVEIVEASVVSPSKQKPSLRNQIGNAETPGKRNGTPNRGANVLQAIADPSDPPEKPAITPSQWLPMGGPEGTSGGRAGLFATSKRTLYAVAARGIYRLTADEKAWTLICESAPTRQFQTPMAEWNDTLYILTDDALLASTDDGNTWETVGPRPEGRAFELLITDDAFYLVFEKHIFRSDDAGKSWIPMMQDLQAYIMKMNSPPHISISDAVALDNKVFIGTNQGLYRVTPEGWKMLSVYGTEPINLLVATETELYVIAGLDFTPNANLFEESLGLDHSAEILKSPPKIFRSVDFGNTWVDISPTIGKNERGELWMELPPTDDGFRLQIFSGIQFVAVGEKLVVMGTRVLLHSPDKGNTWTDIKTDRNSLSQSIFPVVALDENNFYTSDISGIARSTDAGLSWHPFTTGIVNSHVQSLIARENVLYALTAEGIAKSTDLAESWTFVNPNLGGGFRQKGRLRKKQANPDVLSYAKIATANGSFYVSNSTSDKVTLFEFSVDGNVLIPAQGVPAFAEDTLQAEWMKKIRNAAGRRRSELGYQRHTDIPNIIEEQLTNGGFTTADKTVYMEFRHKLFRWRKGEAQWFNTGLVDTTQRAPGADTSKGLTLAASQNSVYAGKRDGSLFQSLDSGEHWKEITADLPFSFAYLEEIVFAGATVYVVTDQGVMHSHDGIHWHALTDTDGNRPLIAQIAVDGDKVYGIGNQSVYRINTDTDTWIQIASEIPYKVTAFAVDRGIFYIGTRHRGVLRLQINQPDN